MPDTDLVDTHCHIHEAGGQDGDDAISGVWQRGGNTDPEVIIQNARRAGVSQMICVGTSLEDSTVAVDFVQNRPDIWASVGVHPHEAKDYVDNTDRLQKIHSLLEKDKVIAIGECGLDYHYEHSSRADQQKLLRFHLELAKEHDLPVIFHIREAFEDFWTIFDGFSGLRGVVHSFSASDAELQQSLSRGLYIGLNGIMTFTSDQNNLLAAKNVPLTKLLLETDAPFLTPKPFRGTICEPKHVSVTAKFLAELRGEPLETLAAATSANAKELFRLS